MAAPASASSGGSQSVQFQSQILEGARDLKASAKQEGSELITKLDQYIKKEEVAVGKPSRFWSSKAEKMHKNNIKDLEKLKKELVSLEKDLDKTKDKDVSKIQKLSDRILACETAASAVFERITPPSHLSQKAPKGPKEQSPDQQAKQELPKQEEAALERSLAGHKTMEMEVKGEKLEGSFRGRANTLLMDDKGEIVQEQEAGAPKQEQSAVAKKTLKDKSEDLRQNYLVQITALRKELRDLRDGKGGIQEEMRGVNDEPKRQFNILDHRVHSLIQKLNVLEARLGGTSSNISELKKAPSILLSSDILQILSQTMDEYNLINDSFKIMTARETVTEEGRDGKDITVTKYKSLKTHAKNVESKLGKVSTDPSRYPGLPPVCVKHIGEKINSKISSLGKLVEKLQARNDNRPPSVAEANQLVEADKLSEELVKAEKDFKEADTLFLDSQLLILDLPGKSQKIPQPDRYNFGIAKTNLLNLTRKLKDEHEAIKKDMANIKSPSDIKKFKARCEKLKKEAEQAKANAEKLASLVDSFQKMVDGRNHVIYGPSPEGRRRGPEDEDPFRNYAVSTLTTFINKREVAVVALSSGNLDGHVKGVSNLDREFNVLQKGVAGQTRSDRWFNAEKDYSKNLNEQQVRLRSLESQHSESPLILASIVNRKEVIGKFDVEKNHLMEVLHSQLDKSTSEKESELAWDAYFTAVEDLTKAFSGEIEKLNTLFVAAHEDFQLAKTNINSTLKMQTEGYALKIPQLNLLDKMVEEINKDLKNAKTASDFKIVSAKMLKLKKDTDRLVKLEDEITRTRNELETNFRIRLGSNNFSYQEFKEFLRERERVAEDLGETNLDSYITGLNRYNDALQILKQKQETWLEKEGIYKSLLDGAVVDLATAEQLDRAQLLSSNSTKPKQRVNGIVNGKKPLVKDLAEKLDTASDHQALSKAWETYFTGLGAVVQAWPENVEEP